MFKSLPLISCFGFLLLILVSCTKIEMRQQKGVYTGYVHESGHYYSIPTGLVQWDTTYPYYVLVKFENKNTIVFQRLNNTRKFEAAPSNYYTSGMGTRHQSIFDLREENILKYSFSQSGGNNSAYYLSFEGTKQ